MSTRESPAPSVTTILPPLWKKPCFILVYRLPDHPRRCSSQDLSLKCLVAPFSSPSLVSPSLCVLVVVLLLDIVGCQRICVRGSIDVAGQLIWRLVVVVSHVETDTEATKNLQGTERLDACGLVRAGVSVGVASFEIAADRVQVFESLRRVEERGRMRGRHPGVHSALEDGASSLLVVVFGGPAAREEDFQHGSVVRLGSVMRRKRTGVVVSEYRSAGFEQGADDGVVSADDGGVHRSLTFVVRHVGIGPVREKRCDEARKASLAGENQAAVARSIGLVDGDWMQAAPELLEPREIVAFGTLVNARVLANEDAHALLKVLLRQMRDALVLGRRSLLVEVLRTALGMSGHKTTSRMRRCSLLCSWSACIQQAPVGY